MDAVEVFVGGWGFPIMTKKVPYKEKKIVKKPPHGKKSNDKATKIRKK